ARALRPHGAYATENRTAGRGAQPQLSVHARPAQTLVGAVLISRAMSRELLAEYPQATDRYDELFEASHTPRAHWRPLIEQLAAYGEQRLLKQGLLPPALVYGHAGYLRACHGAKHAGDVMLHFYAADLARSPDGHWWVLDDRTQAPSGAGYALENRIIISRAFPQLFRDLKVQHLAQFFATLRDSLAHWAPEPEGKMSGSPYTVLLTPGPHNETYFEHTYLARYLGLALVEGNDLTVRDGCVWLKALAGLQRVHAILRRQDDDYCDPLELRSDSALGVPGLVDAVRRGNVLVANALGS